MIAGSTLRATACAHCGERWRRSLAAAFATLLLVSAFAAGGCGSQASGDETTNLTVYAAASLTSAFTELGEKYMDDHPGTEVAFNFAGSQDLVAQLQQGAPADVLATADTETMEKVANLVGTQRIFAENELTIAVAPGNPLGIESLDDLANPDLKVVLAAPEVPAGAYSAQVLKAAGVTVSAVSLEESVKGVVTKVALGEADAGIVYVTDVTAAAGKVDAVEIPAKFNVVATYPLAVVQASAASEQAQEFVDLVLSADGQAILAKYGFLAAQSQ
ncbi:MAG: molybdate ABC transporter substrate-binding protein [Thermoleophilia bacterium]